MHHASDPDTSESYPSFSPNVRTDCTKKYFDNDLKHLRLELYICNRSLYFRFSLTPNETHFQKYLSFIEFQFALWPETRNTYLHKELDILPEICLV